MAFSVLIKGAEIFPGDGPSYEPMLASTVIV
jgi:hypothetical protein